MSLFSLLKLVRYLPMLSKVIRDYESILVGLVKGPHIPDLEQIKLALDDVRLLLDSGLIDIPDLDEAQISKAIGEIEASISGASVEALKNLTKYGDVKGRIEPSVAPDPAHVGIEPHNNPTAPDPSLPVVSQAAQE